jgi:hypothetical protein
MNRACPVLTLLGSDAVIRHGMTLASSQFLCAGAVNHRVNVMQIIYDDLPSTIKVKPS